MTKAEKQIIATIEKLHEGKLGAHWLWVAIERIAAGEKETEVMADYGYTEAKLGLAAVPLAPTISATHTLPASTVAPCSVSSLLVLKYTCCDTRIDVITYFNRCHSHPGNDRLAPPLQWTKRAPGSPKGAPGKPGRLRKLLPGFSFP